MVVVWAVIGGVVMVLVSGAFPAGPARTDIKTMPLTTTAAIGAQRPGVLGEERFPAGNSPGKSAPEGAVGGGRGGGGGTSSTGVT